MLEIIDALHKNTQSQDTITTYTWTGMWHPSVLFFLFLHMSLFNFFSFPPPPHFPSLCTLEKWFALSPLSLIILLCIKCLQALVNTYWYFMLHSAGQGRAKLRGLSLSETGEVRQRIISMTKVAGNFLSDLMPLRHYMAIWQQLNVAAEKLTCS